MMKISIILTSSFILFLTVNICSVHSRSTNIKDASKAYQSLYLSASESPPKSIFSIPRRPKAEVVKPSNSTDNLEPYDRDEFRQPADHSNPLVELEKLLVRVRRDIAVKKRSVEVVAETFETGQKNVIKTIKEAYRNLTKTLSKKDIFNFSSQYTEMGEFPYDFMTDKTREHGGFLVHIAIFVYLSLVLAFICDKYFLKSLEYICDSLNIPSDVGGATFMAIGTSAPELFTSIIGVFISDNDIGTGTIVGSAVFNLLVIPGACGFAAYRHLATKPKISMFPILRDSLFYILTIISLILCLKDNQVDMVESTTLLGLYGVYIVIMYFNAQISNILSNKKTWSPIASTSSNGSNEYVKRKQCLQCVRQKNPSIGSMSSNSDSGIDYKAVKVSESSPLIYIKQNNCRAHSESSSPLPVYESNGHTNPEFIQGNGNDVEIDYSRIRLEQTTDGKFKEVSPSRSDSGADSPASFSQNGSNNKLNTDLDSDWTDNPFLSVLLLPFRIFFLITLPRPSELMFVLTFMSSIIWIALLSYVIVWMVTILGITFGIPDTVAGITILAAGTSIPELISSYLLVKKSGLVDMAICNSIGSNIFDILFCLGLPWLLKTLVTMLSTGVGFARMAAASIPIRSSALPFTSLTLLLTVGCMLAIFKFTHWRLSLKTAICCMTVYITFVITTTLLELSV